MNGILFKSAGAFRMDRPLDPENKFCSHSFVESPEMKNIYDGVAVFDGAGEAIVALPDWFEALNEEFRYQLTPMGAAFVPYVAEEISGNQFKVGRRHPWQEGVMAGDRHSPRRLRKRQPYPGRGAEAGCRSGYLLHAEAFGQPAEKGRSTPTAQDSKATAKDGDAERAEEMKARLRAISQKPRKK